MTTYRRRAPAVSAPAQPVAIGSSRTPTNPAAIANVIAVGTALLASWPAPEALALPGVAEMVRRRCDAWNAQADQAVGMTFARRPVGGGPSSGSTALISERLRELRELLADQ